jgi:hypothetical protein
MPDSQSQGAGNANGNEAYGRARSIQYLSVNYYLPGSRLWYLPEAAFTGI